MRLIFWYVSDGGTAPASEVPRSERPTGNRFALNFWTEGYYLMLRRMLELRIVDDVVVLIDSLRSPGVLDLGKNYSVHVVPSFGSHWRDFLTDETVFFVRSGYRSWFDILSEILDTGAWIMFYRAASNRGPWPFWDVVLDDLSNGAARVDDKGRMYIPFHKPVNEEIFFVSEGEKLYDVCVGSSHIHDKKGQWKTVEAAEAYRRIYGEDLRLVIPGRSIGGMKTRNMFTKFLDSQPNVTMPGMIPRPQLQPIYSQSGLMTHLGGAGQNDRGPLEALCTGTPVVLQNLKWHPLWMHKESIAVKHVPEDSGEGALAVQLRNALQTFAGVDRDAVRSFYLEQNGLEQKTIPEMRRLFWFFRCYPKRDRKLLWKYYEV
jgi:hypothetical protein